MAFVTPKPTLRYLFDAQPGDSFWYTFAYKNRFGQWFLTLTPQQEDQDGSRMVKNVKKMFTLTEDAGTVTSGVVRVDPTGVFLFGGPDPAVDFVPYLQRWVAYDIDNHPELRRLIGGRYQQLTADGLLVNEYKNDGMWEALLPDGVPLLIETQLNMAASVLRRARLGEQCLFWLAPGVLDGHTLLVLRENKTGTDPQRFQNALLRVQGEVGLTQRAVSGFLTAGDKGRFQLRTTSTRNLLGKLADLVRAHLHTHPALGRLIGAQQIQVLENGRDGDVIEDGALWEGLTRPQLEADTAILQALRRSLKSVEPGARFHFDFANEGPSGSPLLVLTPVGEDSKRAHAAARKTLTEGGKPLTRPLGGFAHARSDGKPGLSFRAQADAADFLPSLAGFVKNNLRREPALRALRDSVFAVVGEDGKPTNKFRDDSLWADLD